MGCKRAIEKLPEQIKSIRHAAKAGVYAFVQQDGFIEELATRVIKFIPVEVIYYSMAKVLQELFTDYPFIIEASQPLRVYSKNFPICFDWNNNLKESFTWLREKKYGEKAGWA